MDGVNQIHDLRNGHCGVGIWYVIYGRCSDFLTLRGVGIWEIVASAVERLFKAVNLGKKYIAKLPGTFAYFLQN